MRSQFEKLALVFDLKRIKVDHQFTPLVIDWQVAKAIENLYYGLSTFDYYIRFSEKRMPKYLIMTYVLHLLTTQQQSRSS
jgi:hypothetical protein